MIFAVKLLITFVATHPLVILTKFGQNPIKHVEEETNCEKKEEERRRRGNHKKENKLGETPNLNSFNIALIVTYTTLTIFVCNVSKFHSLHRKPIRFKHL